MTDTVWVSADLPTPSVVLVDAHPSILLSAAMVLEQEDIDVAAATADLAVATRLCRSGRADVIVLDPHGQPGPWRATIAGLRRQLPSIAIVVMTMESSLAYVRVALGAGADAYVLKSHADTELPPAVRAALPGRQVMSRDVLSALTAGAI